MCIRDRSGHVVIENQNGVVLCNGHAFRDIKLGTDNTNFALLVSHEFSEPFDNPNQFAYEVAKLANKLSGGSVIVQTYGDILKDVYKRQLEYARNVLGFDEASAPLFTKTGEKNGAMRLGLYEMCIRDSLTTT